MEPAVIALLLQNAGLGTLVDRRVNYRIRPQGEPLPAVVVHKVSGVPSRTLDGRVSITRSRIQIDCWGDGPGQASVVAGAVKAALDRAVFAHPAAVIRGAFLIDEQDDDASAPVADQNPNRTRLDFRVHHTSA